MHLLEWGLIAKAKFSSRGIFSALILIFVTFPAQATNKIKIVYNHTNDQSYFDIRSRYGHYQVHFAGDLVGSLQNSSYERQSRGRVRGRRAETLSAALSQSSNRFALYVMTRRHPTPLIFIGRSLSPIPKSIRIIRTSRARARALLFGKSCATLGDNVMRLSSPRATDRSALFSPKRSVSIAVDTDLEFAAHFKDATASTVREIVNAASALYGHQIGLTLALEGVHLPDLESQIALKSLNAPILLDEFRNYSQAQGQLGNANIYHLLTGKSLRSSFIGISFQDSACQESGSYAYSLSQRVDPTLQPLLLAHEVAHVLGAHHDDSSGPSLMNTYVEGESSKFSQNSIDEIQAYLSESGSCIGVVQEPTITLTTSFKRGVVKLQASIANLNASNCSLSVFGSQAQRRLTGSFDQAIPVMQLPSLSSHSKIAVTAKHVPNSQGALRGYVKAILSCPSGVTVASRATEIHVTGETNKRLARRAPKTFERWLRAVVRVGFAS